MNNIIIMLVLLITATGYTQKKAGTAKKQVSKNITGKSHIVKKQTAIADISKPNKNINETTVISGTVSDVTGPLPGATVIVRGSLTLAQTDLDGKYSIEARKGEVFEVSFLGFETQNINIGQSNVINVLLLEYREPGPVRLDCAYPVPKDNLLNGSTQIVTISETENRNRDFNFKVSEKQIKKIKYDTLNSGWIVVKNVPNPHLDKDSKNYAIIKKQGRKNITIAYRSEIAYQNGQSLYIIDDIPTDENGFKLINQSNIKSINIFKPEHAVLNSAYLISRSIVIVTTNMSRKEKKNFQKILEQNEIKDTNDSNAAILKSLSGNLSPLHISAGTSAPGNDNNVELMPFTEVGLSTASDSITKTPEQQFMADFNNKNIRLYVLGGIAAVITTKDNVFAQKSGFTYHDFGCLAPPDITYYEKYNHLVLNHLKLNLKKGWQAKIAPNIIGLQNWKENK